MSVKPLKQLFAEADSLIGNASSHSKTASAAFPCDDVANLAEALISAGALEKVAESNSVATEPADQEFEKLAMAVNRAEATLQLEQLKKFAQFEERAREAGYSDEQISEAIEKIAAKETKAQLPILTALSMDLMSPHSEGKNSIEAKKVPANNIGQGKIQKSVSESAGC